MESGGHTIKFSFPLGFAGGAALWLMEIYEYRPGPVVTVVIILLTLLCLGWSVYWGLDELGKWWERRNLTACATGPFSAPVQMVGGGTFFPATAIRRDPVRDVSVQDAIFYAMHGRWLDVNETATGVDGYAQKLGQIVGKIRQVALDDRLMIWGKKDGGRVYEKIDPSYWTNHILDQLSVTELDMPRNPSQAKTRNINHDSSTPTYTDLMTTKSQVEYLCRAGNI